MEILPGIHRIESDLGARFMCQYLLTGEYHTVLVDTGLAGTPEEVIISHADVDHCGGNRALKERHPSLWFSCGEPDRAWIENNELMLSDIYRWYEPYGFGPDEDSVEWIREELGGGSPVDAGLRGGDHHRRGARDRHLRPRGEPSDPPALLRRPRLPEHDPKAPDSPPGTPPHRPLPAHAGGGSHRFSRPLPEVHAAGPKRGEGGAGRGDHGPPGADRARRRAARPLPGVRS